MSTPFPDTVLMIRPAAFGYDEGTARTNRFQKAPSSDGERVHKEALAEFEAVKERLELLGVQVMVFEDTPDPPKPSAIFPNNWISFHEDGSVVLYPMLTESRKKERRSEIPERIEAESRFRVRRSIELSAYEQEGKALEGTGSIVFDREMRIAYACRSPRTDIPLFEQLCERLGYQPVSFKAFDEQGAAIYHTNVMLALGAGFAILCEEVIEDPMERSMVKLQLQESGRKLIIIDRDQLRAFAGNAYQLCSSEGDHHFLLSKRACDSLNEEQLQRIESHSAIECLPVGHIEEAGGGSIRCMMAGIFLPEKDPERS